MMHRLVKSSILVNQADSLNHSDFSMRLIQIYIEFIQLHSDLLIQIHSFRFISRFRLNQTYSMLLLTLTAAYSLTPLSVCIFIQFVRIFDSLSMADQEVLIFQMVYESELS